jgi:heme exporter protein C
MPLHRFANPGRFMRLADRLLPWTGGLAVLAIGIGLVLGLFVAPPDYQQGESVRIMYVHVPAAWMALFVYTCIAVASAVSLIWRHPLADLAAKASSPVGAAFTFLALVTGSLWGKPMWGTWWVWDARLTSVLVLFFLYLGHMALMTAFEDPARGRKAAAVLALVGFVNVPIIKFSVDWWNTLHQPSSVLRLDGPSIGRGLQALLRLAAADPHQERAYRGAIAGARACRHDLGAGAGAGRAVGRGTGHVVAFEFPGDGRIRRLRGREPAPPQGRAKGARPLGSSISVAAPAPHVGRCADMMKRKHRRLVAVLVGLTALAGATALVLTAFQDNIMLFYSPSDLAEGPPQNARSFRLGGLVEEGSVRQMNGGPTVEFRITDLAESVPVTYTGILPDLFREGQGVVAEGVLNGAGVFEAREVLAKHDETYMPPEVAEALKAAGQWQGDEAEETAQ